MTLQGKEGERPMVRKRIAIDTGKAEVTKAGTTTEGMMAMTTQDGDDVCRHHNDATISQMGRCLVRTANERGKRLRLLLCPGRRQICNCGSIPLQMPSRLAP